MKQLVMVHEHCLSEKNDGGGVKVKERERGRSR